VNARSVGSKTIQLSTLAYYSVQRASMQLGRCCMPITAVLVKRVKYCCHHV